MCVWWFTIEHVVFNAASETTQSISSFSHIKCCSHRAHSRHGHCDVTLWFVECRFGVCFAVALLDYRLRCVVFNLFFFKLVFSGMIDTSNDLRFRSAQLMEKATLFGERLTSKEVGSNM